MNKDIKYYKDINRQDFIVLQSWFIDFIKENKRELLYKGIVLAEFLEYKIVMTMEMNANITFYIAKDEEKIAFEFAYAPLYNKTDKAFMSLLIMLKRLRKMCSE
jgi:hypothetical protein